MCVPRLSTARETHFLCCRSCTQPTYFSGGCASAPCRVAVGACGPEQARIRRGSGEKTELFFSPLLKVTHCTDPACLCHNNCFRLYLCLAHARLSGCACMFTQGLAFSHCACPTLHSMKLTFCVAGLAASQFFIWCGEPASPRTGHI